ncbi:uncharacterized protein METZ01_LOCUS486432, partial [marine metagenome]
VDAFLSTPAALADVLARTLVLQKAYLNTSLKALLTANTLTVDGTSKTYTSIVTDIGSVTDIDAWIDTYTDAMTNGAAVSLTSFFGAIDTYVTTQSAGSPSANDLGLALTKVNSGAKAINFSQVMGGQLVNDDGGFASGVTQSSFDTSVTALVDTAVTLATDTIGDVLGADTSANFPDATVLILTDGNDTANGTEGSDLIATLMGTDTVNGLGGTDKIIGSAGVDTLNGGGGIDHIYGYGG